MKQILAIPVVIKNHDDHGLTYRANINKFGDGESVVTFKTAEHERASADLHRSLVLNFSRRTVGFWRTAVRYGWCAV